MLAPVAGGGLGMAYRNDWQFILLMVAALIVEPVPGGPARAADVTAVKGPDGKAFVAIVGEFKRGDEQKFRAVTANFGSATVFLKSPGGDLEAGLSIGEQIRERGYATAVAFDNTCASSCALAWLGGMSRRISPSARVGFHAAYTLDNGEANQAGSANALVGAYLGRIGVSDAAIASLTSAAPLDMHWLTEPDAKALNMNVSFSDAGEEVMTSKSKSAAISALYLALSAPTAYSADPLSRAVQQGYDNGFHDCARALDKIVKFFHENDSEYALFGQWSQTDANNKMFTTMTSVPSRDGNTIISFTATKNASGTCSISATEIISSQQSCLQVRDEDFKDWRYYGDLAGSTILEDPTAVNDSVILNNTPNNTCLIVKHLVALDANQ